MEQTQFLGASIRNFTCSLGWNSQVTELRVGLVNDPSNGDAFLPPNIGSPVYFAFGNLSIGGLLTNVTTNRGPEGNPLFEVTVQDPRSILEGVQLILEGYNGSTFSVPNLYNIFGYLEALGDAGTNSSGMEWFRIRRAFLILQESSPIRFAGYSYYLDLSNLSSLPLPNYYRIGSENYSMMDFLSEICEAAGCDFYFRLLLVGNRNILKIYTISRTSAPQLGLISTYLNSIDQKVRTNVGFELRNETTSKFLVGGNVAQIYFQTHNSGELDDWTDDTIWPYWGLEENGDIIRSSGNIDSNHYFTLPSRAVNVVGVGATYTTNLDELRAALAGQNAWELLLNAYNDDPNSIHHQKATKIGLMCDVKLDEVLFSRFTVDELTGMAPSELINFLGTNIKRTGNSLNSDHEENVARLYEYIRRYAEEFYGKKFMVRVPFVTAEFDAENNKILTSLEPTDGGFIEEALFSGAVSNGLMPFNVNFVTLDDGRTGCYVKFPNKDFFDFSDLSSEDYVYNQIDDSVFVKASLEPDLQFLDRSTAFSPRAILTLPGRVTLNFEGYKGLHLGLFEKLVLEKVDKAHPGLTEEQKRRIYNNLINRSGAELAFLGFQGLMVMPGFVAVPLKSNVDFYGPWYAVGAEGKTEFEKDDTLVPWNYGGFALMNLAANARVSESLTNFQVGEGGTIEIPGFPTFNLGDQLIFGGPYLTDIQVNVSDQGVTTTYRMNTWTQRFGKIPKTYIDTLQKIKIQERKNRRLLRDLTKLPTPENIKFKQRESYFLLHRPARREGKTSSPIIMGDVLQGSGDLKKANIVFSPHYNAINHIAQSGYDTKVVNSLDTLFRPFSTDPNANGWPKYEVPEGSGVNLTKLNPYTRDSDFILYNADYPQDDEFLNEASGYIRGVALRGPIVMAGWGYDTGGNPVPSGEDGGFIENYKKRMDQWKVGPVDLRWNDEKKIWVGGNLTIQRGTLNTTLTFEGSATATDSDTGDTDTVYDHLLSTGQVVDAGKKIIYALIGSRRYVIGAQC